MSALTDERIGVFVCECGTNIAATVNVLEVAEFASKLDGVVVSMVHKYMCSDPGQEMIKKAIEDDKLTRVVVASCSPLMHEPTFRAAVTAAGMNPFLYQHANIREHVSWVTPDVRDATEKSKRLIQAAVRRVMLHAPLSTKKVPVRSEVVVIGGGIAGIEAALACAEAGKRVYLIEKESSIGGHMAQFDKTFPTLDCAACILTPKMVSVRRNPNITMYTYSEVAEVSGYVGNFKVKVRKKARYVDETKCTGCSQCWTECPSVRSPIARRIEVEGPKGPEGEWIKVGETKVPLNHPTMKAVPKFALGMPDDLAAALAAAMIAETHHE